MVMSLDAFQLKILKFVYTFLLIDFVLFKLTLVIKGEFLALI